MGMQFRGGDGRKEIVNWRKKGQGARGERHVRRAENKKGKASGEERGRRGWWGKRGQKLAILNRPQKRMAPNNLDPPRGCPGKEVRELP